MPALNAYVLDASPEQSRAQMIGLKEALFSLGGLAGPALVVLAIRYFQPVGIFIIAGSLILFSALLVPFRPGMQPYANKEIHHFEHTNYRIQSKSFRTS